MDFPSTIDVSGPIETEKLFPAEWLVQTDGDPFGLFPKVKAEFDAARGDLRLQATKRALMATSLHMSHIGGKKGSNVAAQVAINNPGLHAILRSLTPVEDREKNRMQAANPDWAETPFIRAAETLNKTIFDEQREANPNEKRQLGQLAVLAIQHLDSLEPGADMQLPLYVRLLEEEGFNLGDHIPQTVLQNLQDLESAPAKNGPTGNDDMQP